MTDPLPAVPERLDSWKAIAAYLSRDVATVRRWEKTLGLPVRRVPGGRGHSVFAYSSEIDAWLKAKPEVTREAASQAPASRRAWLVAGAVLALSIAIAAGTRATRLTAAELRIEITPEAVVAFDGAGAARWRHDFSTEYKTALSEVGERARVARRDPAAVYFATSHRERLSDGRLESGSLVSLDLAGHPTGSFSFDDDVALGGKRFGPPWAITSFALDEAAGARRVAVAAHHFLWSPSLVTVLDDHWRRQGTFVHEGWIEGLYWLAPNRLVTGGFSDARDGGMIALLDTAALGTSPPLRILVMPRSEVNRATVSRFNRAALQVMPDRIVARTIEVPADAREAVDAIYEFTRSLEVVKASFSDRYWEVHRSLEAQGKLDHPRERCRDRDGPREIAQWEPATGWRTSKLR